MEDLKQFSNTEILTHLKTSLSSERNAIAHFLTCLFEVNSRKLFVDLGFPNLFSFLTQCLGLSEGCAFRRSQALSVMKTFPEVVELIRKGKVTLSTLNLLSPVLTPGNAATLFAKSEGRSKRDVEWLVAEVREAERKKSEEKLPLPALFEKGEREELELRTQTESQTLLKAAASKFLPTKPTRKNPVVHVISPCEARVSITLSRNLLEKLGRCKELLHGTKTGKQLEATLKRLCDEFLDRHAPEKRAERAEAHREKKGAKEKNQTCAGVGQPIKDKASAKETQRHIPEALRLEVLKRDGYQCVFVGMTGTRCPAKAGLEINHRTPFARQGPTVLSNLECLCKTHNLRQAELDFGIEFIRSKQNSAKQASN